MEPFNLLDYLDEIRAISRVNKCTLTAAVDRMILNLNTFNEYNKGTGTINYHLLGHQWGALTATQKIEQKKEAKKVIAQNDYSSTRSHRNRGRA